MVSSELENSFGQLLAYYKAKEMIALLRSGEEFNLQMLTQVVESINRDIDFTDALWGALRNRDYKTLKCLQNATKEFLENEIANLGDIDPEMVKTRKLQLEMIKNLDHHSDELRYGQG